MTKYSEKFFNYCIDVSRNKCLKTELKNLKSIADEVLQEWKSKYEDKHRTNVRHSCIQIEDDGELTFIVVFNGLGIHECKDALENYMKENIMKKWGLEVFVYYEPN
jgi:hypothetical protein